MPTHFFAYCAKAQPYNANLRPIKRAQFQHTHVTRHCLWNLIPKGRSSRHSSCNAPSHHDTRMCNEVAHFKHETTYNNTLRGFWSYTHTHQNDEASYANVEHMFSVWSPNLACNSKVSCPNSRRNLDFQVHGPRHHMALSSLSPKPQTKLSLLFLLALKLVSEPTDKTVASLLACALIWLSCKLLLVCYIILSPQSYHGISLSWPLTWPDGWHLHVTLTLVYNVGVTTCF